MKILDTIKGLVFAACCSLAFSHPAMATSNTATLTAGGTNASCGSRQINHLTGFGSGVMGAYDPQALTGGQSVQAVYDITVVDCPLPYASFVAISGFSSNPGKNWLISITCNGFQLTGANSAAYAYGSGQASWNWSTGFGFVSGNYTCTIVH